MRVVEHVARVRRCVGCGRVHAGRFPESVKAPVSYGERIKALGVYLHVFQHIPYERACQLLGDLAGVEISTGTLVAWVDQAAAGLCAFDEELRKLLSPSRLCASMRRAPGSPGASTGSTRPPRRR